MRVMESLVRSSYLFFSLATALLVAGVCSVLAEPAAGSGSIAKKAATIYNLCKFIRWPAAEAGRIIDSGNFRICVVNSRELARELAGLEGAAVGGDPLQITEIDPDLSGIDHCRVLFLAYGAHSLLITGLTLLLPGQKPIPCSPSVMPLVLPGMGV